MKKLFYILILLFVNAVMLNAFTIKQVNSIDIYCYRSDLPYDYTAVFIERGYGQTGSNPAAIAAALKDNEALAMRYFQYTLYDDYLLLEFITEAGSSADILSSINSLHNMNYEAPIQYIRNLSAYDRAFIKRNYMSYSGHKHDGIRIKAIVTSTSSSEENIFSIASGIIPGTGQKSIKKVNTGKEIALNDYEGDFIFFDTDIKDYDFPLYLILREVNDCALLWNNDKGNLIINRNAVPDADSIIFYNAKTRLLQRINESGLSPYSLVKYFPQLIYSGNIRMLSGISERIKNTTYNDFTLFQKGIKPDFAIREQALNAKFMKPRLLNTDDMQLIYYPSSDIGTELTVIVKNAIGMESYYAKPFASALAIRAAMAVCPSWKMWNVNENSDIIMLSTKVDSLHIESTLKELVNAVLEPRISIIRDMSIMDTLSAEYRRNNMLNPSSVMRTGRENPGYDAVKMTDGEYRTLLKKLFASDNVIVSISSSLRPEYFVELFSGLRFPGSAVSPDIQYDAEIEMKEYAYYDNNSSMLNELVKSFFISPEYFVIDSNSFMMPVKLMNAQRDIRNALMPSAFVNKNAMSVINAISMYLFRDPSYILTILR